MRDEHSRRSRSYIVLMMFLTLAIVGVLFLVQICLKQNKEIRAAQKDAEQRAEGSQEQAAAGKENQGRETDRQKESKPDAETADAAETAAEETPPAEPVPQPGMEDLKQQIQTSLEGRSGTWSVYVENLKDQTCLTINNQKLKAASLIKLYIMGAVYERIDAGTMEKTEEVSRLLDQMITVSDNESANELVRRLSPTGSDHPAGMEAVNAFAREQGYEMTSQGRDLQDFRTEPPPGENYTSVEDCGKFLRRVYSKQCISQAVSEEMLTLLRNQERDWKIPAGLPEGTQVANKTGELSDTESDVAIVSSPACDYILCVMSSDLTDVGNAQQKIVDISRLVYQYFNGT